MTIYPAGTTNFDYQGYGTLYDAYSAEVTEASSTNGNITETMEITYPVNGVLSDKMVEGNLVKAQISKTDGDYQIFEIDETEKSDNTVITAYLNAYPYRVLRMSFSNGGKFANFETLTRLLDYAKSCMPDLPTDFNITTNISNPINLAQVQTDPSLTPVPTVFKDFSSLLDAILNKVSGQVKFGPRSIEILAHRGQDKSNIELRDDKNTNGISVKIDTTNIVNKIIPLLPVKDKDGNSTSETVVGRIVTPKDPFRFINFYSGQVVNVDTQDLADSYFSRTNCNYPVTTATVTTSMIDEDLSDIRLFDVVSVYSSRINYTAKLKVSERVFDVLAGAVDSFKLGTSSVNVFSTQTAAMNQVEQAVAIGNQALTSANGKNTNYYGDAKPTDGKEGDIWFHTVDGVSQMDQFSGGVWKTIVSDTFGKEVDKKVATAQAEASDAKTKAEEGIAKAESTVAKFDDTNQKVKQALDNSVSAQADALSAVAKAESTASEFGKVKKDTASALSAASSAVSKANSTASEFGKVSQKTASALTAALNAQTDANSAVAQASSAAADSKDAKKIAGAVSQSYKTLTDGSTMTIAELQNGLAAKLTKTDLKGYATQDWAQNQIKITANGINGTISSIKNTVDSQTTSINDLKADSSSFKSKFTTVNNTLGKQSTDIGTLQASSKELTSGFNTLTTDNKTNKNDISQLRQTATELSSTMTTVTQRINLDDRPNLLTGNLQDLNNWDKNKVAQNAVKNNVFANGTNTMSYQGVSGVEIISATLPTVAGNSYIVSIDFTSTSFGTITGYGWGPSIDFGTDQDHFVTLESGANNKRYLFRFVASGNDTLYLRFGNVSDGASNTLVFANLSLQLDAASQATATQFSNISQTVDSIKTDISKKIEQKDLNGYATQTWTQNRIKMTADGINGTLSKVKSTVDGHTTSINDLKADSRGFKAQFTTVNNTISKHTTDISTLHSDSERLSSNFSSLNTANGTNEHNISDLQQSAKELSSTLLTVKNSGGGTNLIANSANDLILDDTINKQGYLRKTVYDGLIAGQQYTFTSDVTVNTGNVAQIRVRTMNDGQTSDGPKKSVDIVNGHISWTFTAAQDKPILLVYAGIDSKTAGNKVTFHHYQLETGIVAHDWSPAPEDLATVTAVSSISQTIDSIQATVRGKVDNDVYQSKVVQLSNQLTSVVGQVNTLGQRNLVANSQFQYDKFDGSTWTSDKADNWYLSEYNWSWWNGYQGICCNIPITDPVNTNQWNSIVSKKIYVPDTASVYSGSAIFNVAKIGGRTQLVLDWYDKSMKRIGYAAKGVTVFGKKTLVKIENQTPPTGTAYVALHVDVKGGGHLAVIAPMLVNAASVGSYVPDNVSWTEVQQTASDINLRVEKAGVINAINISPEGTQIYGNKLHITASTYIDNAVIKDAMISNVSANKMTTGTLNAANVNIINLNGRNIVSNSITSNQLASGSVTANKIQSGAIRVSLNNSLQRLEIGVDGLNLMSNDGAVIGRIHSNHMDYDSTFWGLTFDMSANGGDFMAWGAQNNGDVNGIYQTKLAWYRWSTHGYAGGFHFQDRVEFHDTVDFRSEIDTKANYLLKFGSTNVNGYSSVPYLGLAGGATKISFSPNSVWISRHHSYYNMGAVIEGLSKLAGRAIFIPTGMRSDGRAASWTGINMPSE